MCRRQPEHFMKVSCQRMGVLFSLHLGLAALTFSLFSFVQCHHYIWDIITKQYVCTDHLKVDHHHHDYEVQLQTKVKRRFAKI